jgi:hypothetical protein
MNMTTDRMIETFDPQKGKWHFHVLDTCRLVGRRETLLYRACGVLNGENMENEVNKQPSLHGDQPPPKLLKRPRDPDDSEKTPPRGVREHGKVQHLLEQDIEPQSLHRQASSPNMSNLFEDPSPSNTLPSPGSLQGSLKLARGMKPRQHVKGKTLEPKENA